MLWPKPRSLILIKKPIENIKDQPQPLSVWSTHNPHDIKTPGRHAVSSSKASKRARVTQGLGDFKFLKVKVKIALTSSPHLVDWLLLSKLYAGRKIKVGDSITGSCGSIMVAAVTPENI